MAIERGGEAGDEIAAGNGHLSDHEDDKRASRGPWLNFGLHAIASITVEGGAK